MIVITYQGKSFSWKTTVWKEYNWVHFGVAFTYRNVNEERLSVTCQRDYFKGQQAEPDVLNVKINGRRTRVIGVTRVKRQA